MESFPKTLEKEVAVARKEAAAEVEKELGGQAHVTTVERDWEKKMLGEKITHLEGVVEFREKEIEQLKGELNTAQQRVQQIADKAVEGASLSQAYRSVNKIALEQARKPEGLPPQ